MFSNHKCFGVCKYFTLSAKCPKSIGRCSASSTDSAAACFVQELCTVRSWSACQHPHWLVFEAEGQLQIRPVQHKVANHLLSHPGDIAQLNMGEGKTRVILPMLMLHWANGSQLVRGGGVHCRCTGVCRGHYSINSQYIVKRLETPYK